MFVFILFFVLFCSCSTKNEPPDEVVARVNNVFLTKKALKQLVGNEITNPNSFLHATNRWVEKTLLYNDAIKKNLQMDKNLINQKEAFYKDLLITSYLNITKKNKVVVNKKEISNYYNKNKKSFTRLNEEVLVRHFIISSKKEAETIKKTIRKNKKGGGVEDILEKHKPQRRFLNKGLLEDNLVGFVFDAHVGEVVGPKKHGKDYHLFQILKKHKKGSVRGLEFVYDEIYQRLFKQKEAFVLSSVLDSLYSNSNVYISPEVLK